MSTMEKMNVHKALAELKIIDDRIVKAILEGTYCVTNKHSNEKIWGVPVKDFEANIIAHHQKANDLINRANAIKRAVVLSNAVTKVTVAGKEYTVAEAISMKNHGIKYYESFLQELRRQYSTAKKEITLRNGDELETRANNYVATLLGGKEKLNTEEANTMKETFIKAQSVELVDPIRILDKINELEDMIANFQAEVDSALSYSNAITEISIEY